MVLSFSTVTHPKINGTRGSASPWHCSTGISLLMPITDYTDKYRERVRGWGGGVNINRSRWIHTHTSSRMDRKGEIYTLEMFYVPLRESS